MTMVQARKRTEQTHRIVCGTIEELEASVRSSNATLARNSRMIAASKETTGSPNASKSPGSPSGSSSRNLTEHEREILKRELRRTIEAAGEERDPTVDEIEAAVKGRINARKFTKQTTERFSRIALTPIIQALEKLAETSNESLLELQAHEERLVNMLAQLDEMIDNLSEHKKMRDSLFDPLRSTDLPHARNRSGSPIKRSVLYQKMNFMVKDADGNVMKPDWNDKDHEATEGKLGSIMDSKGHKGLTGHEATFCAAEREDTARALCNMSLKAVRLANSRMETRKSLLQAAVINSRELATKQKKTAKIGKFGSNEERNTDPTSRGKIPTNPDDRG